jgi:hypothetical protein
MEMEQGNAGQVRRERGSMLIGTVPVRDVLKEDEDLLERVRVAGQAARLQLLPAVCGAGGSPGMVCAQLVQQAASPAVGLRPGWQVHAVQSAARGKDSMTGKASGTAPPAPASSAARQEVARPGHHVVVDGARRGERLECGLDIHRQAGRQRASGSRTWPNPPSSFR